MRGYPKSSQLSKQRQHPSRRHDAHHVPARVHQRPARIARLHWQADLEIARGIRRACQRRDFSFGKHGEMMNEEG